MNRCNNFEVFLILKYVVIEPIILGPVSRQVILGWWIRCYLTSITIVIIKIK